MCSHNQQVINKFSEYKELIEGEQPKVFSVDELKCCDIGGGPWYEQYIARKQSQSRR